jgi:quercetin dioxygenase-like cupin family protein
MLLPLHSLPAVVVPHFKGGEKEALVQKFEDENGKILILTLAPGASIGMHTHTDSSEMIYVLSGRATASGSDGEEALAPGVCHYCAKGCSHGIVNDGTEDLVLFAVVPRQ